MPEGSASDDLRAPDEWDKLEGLDWKWRNIRMKELVYSELPQGTAAAIEDFIRVDKCAGQDIVRVHRLDPQTIEVVWHDDEGLDADDPSPTSVSEYYIRNVRTVIQAVFGEHWRVRRKPDERRHSGEHPQRAIIRRADHQRFKYDDESDDRYLLNLHGRPDNVPEDVDYVRQLDQYRDDPELPVGDPRDVYLYETESGTIHLLPSIRDRTVAVDQHSECGLTVPAEEIVDGERVEHYSDYLSREREWDDLDPETQIGDDLCGRCWRSYAEPRRGFDGKVRGYEAPNVDYAALLPEVDHD